MAFWFATALSAAAQSSSLKTACSPATLGTLETGCGVPVDASKARFFAVASVLAFELEDGALT